VSFALPVRNGIDTANRCLDSLLAQDDPNFEIVISDNASDDGTRELLQEYAAKDSRIRLLLNEKNVGQIENFNRVFHGTRGEFVRWIGIDDWLEPNYITRCVRTFDLLPHIIGVTTNFRLYVEDAGIFYEDYYGERLESPLPERRLARMLWYGHSTGSSQYPKQRWYDPIYSMFKREMLAKTDLLRVMCHADLMLSVEISLWGRCEHLHECLAHRALDYNAFADRANLMKRYHPTRYKELPSYPWRLLSVLRAIISKVPMTPQQRRVCRRKALGFVTAHSYRRIRFAITNFRRRLYIRRDKIPFLRQRSVSGGVR
jgi:glycosyltransferase involved in cell wall biosynthesis